MMERTLLQGYSPHAPGAERKTYNTIGILFDWKNINQLKFYLIFSLPLSLFIIIVFQERLPF